MPPNKSTQASRLELIIPVLEANNYHLTTEQARELAVKTGSSPRTIYRDANSYKDQQAIIELGSREENRLKLIKRIDAALDGAETNHSYTALSSLLALKSKLQGLDIPPASLEAPEDVPEDVEYGDPLERTRRLLSETRALRIDARSKGSLIAAQKLLESEVQLNNEVRALEIEQAKALEEQATDEEMLLSMATDVMSLPEPLYKKFCALIGSIPNVNRQV